MTQLSLQMIAQALDGRVVGKTVRAPGPGHSKHDDSLAVALADNDDGFVVTSHAGDDFRECKDYVRERLGLDEFGAGRRELDPDELARRAQSRAEAEAADEAARLSRLKWCADIWKASVPLSGSIAEMYLGRRLAGFQVPEAIYQSDAIRWNPTLLSFNGKAVPNAAGAMVAKMTDPVTGQGTGIHRTWLTAAGDKISRAMAGNAGVCRLWADDAVTIGLAIGEGIETTLAASILFGFSPCWAALDAGNLAAFPVLDGIEALTIFADADAADKRGRRAGTHAAQQCADRWVEAQREIITRVPTGTAKNDFCDMIVDLSQGRAA